jgi:chromate reductase
LVITHSISDISGALANHALRQILTFINMPVLQQPEVYLANSQKLLDEHGNITNDETKDFLKSVVTAFISFTEKFLK